MSRTPQEARRRAPRPPGRRGRAALASALALALVPVGSAAASAATGPALVDDPTSFVDPLVGTTNAGNTFPGAVRPFGMAAWSPELFRGTSPQRTAAPGGYAYDADQVRGFSLTHLSATGCAGASGDVPFFPYPGEVDSSPSADGTGEVYSTTFSHEHETAEAGRYAVDLDSGVGVDLTTTERTGSGRFTYPAGSPATMLLRTSDSELGSTDATVDIDAATRTVSGSVTSGNFCGYIGGDSGTNAGAVDRRPYYTLYFTVQFDTDFASEGTWVDDALSPGSTAASGGTTFGEDGFPPAGRGSGGYVTFEADDDGPTEVGARVGISYVSLEGAQANLRAENPPGTTFDEVREGARDAWDEQLSRVRVGGGTQDRTTTFYTALYHALIHPSLASDVDGRYRGFGDTVADQEVQHVREGQGAQYANFSGWDVYRGQVQLLSWLQPQVGSDLATSLLNQAEQNDGVWDRWTHQSGATHVMAGDPSPTALAGIHAFGGTGFPLEESLDSLVRAATVPTALDGTDLGGNVAPIGQRPSLADYLEHGYYPAGCFAWGCADETLENSVADDAIAELARDAGRDDVVAQFAPRAQAWQRQFHHGATPGGGYFQDRRADGTWVPNARREGEDGQTEEYFDPASSAGFVEGTAAVYVWHVQHDPAGLIATMGGDDAAVSRLDGHFRGPDGSWRLVGSWDDNTYVNMDNEPSIHVPYLYSYAGAPWKAAETVRATMDQIWSPEPGGIPGNDDLGTMSSWYVFSAMGAYPVDPSRNELVLGSPLFPRVEVRPEGGAPVTITADGAGTDAQYVTGVRVDGERWTRSSLPTSLVADGGDVELELSATPDPAFGADRADRPTSMREGEVSYTAQAPAEPVQVRQGGSATAQVVVRRYSGLGEVHLRADAPTGLRVRPVPRAADVPRRQESTTVDLEVSAVGTGRLRPGTYDVPVTLDLRAEPGDVDTDPEPVVLTVEVLPAH
ncbi:GH92 family glycosyl hydrolase [Pseudokineococcus basanitobsidens]|uniref:GH92 family glycosyl hydrolase n=1 Tax=Pseudokineococcus basanitobsidens TaxID=1926649 RepID=A0ABU8RNL5_9ACTN